jgi:hypothetical protein
MLRHYGRCVFTVTTLCAYHQVTREADGGYHIQPDPTDAVSHAEAQRSGAVADEPAVEGLLKEGYGAFVVPVPGHLHPRSGKSARASGGQAWSRWLSWRPLTLAGLIGPCSSAN